MEEEFGIDQIKNWLRGGFQATDTIDDVIEDGKINWADAMKVLGLQEIVSNFTGNPELVEQVQDLSEEEIQELQEFKDELLEQYTSDEERDRGTIILDSILEFALVAVKSLNRIKESLSGE